MNAHHAHRFLPVLLCIVALQSCHFFTEERKTEQPKPLISRPSVAMSEEFVRSKAGDVLCFMPKNWSLVDIQGKASSDILAVATNPEYTLSMVVQSVRTNDMVHQAVQREGLIGLARIAFDKRSRKTANNVKLIGPIGKQEYANGMFGYYEFCEEGADTTVMRSRSIVLISSINNYYEVSLVPTAVTIAKIPDEEQMMQVFQSIVVSLKF